MKSFTVLLAILASSLAFSASAQTAPPSPPVESVIVTARHTQEREQDVPISMSVLTAD